MLALIQDEKPGKFSHHTKEMVYLGPSENTSRFKLWNPLTDKVQHNRNVQFFETLAPVSNRPKPSPSHHPFLVPSDVDILSFVLYHHSDEMVNSDLGSEAPDVTVLPALTEATSPPMPLKPPLLPPPHISLPLQTR